MTKDNNMYIKQQYKCAICEKIYDDVQSRMNCEMACLKKQYEAEKRAAEEKKKAERDARFKEVNEALDNAYNLVNKYVEDYGSFSYGGKYKGLDMLNMDYFPAKLWHHFWY